MKHTNNSPVQKVDNVRMAQVLEDTNLLLNHVLMSFDSLLQNDLHSHIVASVEGSCLLDGAVRSSAYSCVSSRSVNYICEFIILIELLSCLLLTCSFFNSPRSRPNS